MQMDYLLTPINISLRRRFNQTDIDLDYINIYRNHHHLLLLLTNPRNRETRTISVNSFSAN